MIYEAHISVPEEYDFVIHEDYEVMLSVSHPGYDAFGSRLPGVDRTPVKNPYALMTDVIYHIAKARHEHNIPFLIFKTADPRVRKTFMRACKHKIPDMDVLETGNDVVLIPKVNDDVVWG